MTIKTKKGTGYLVQTKDGKTGRTYHILGLIHGKVPVFLENDNEGEYVSKPKLYQPTTLKKIGFID